MQLYRLPCFAVGRLQRFDVSTASATKFHLDQRNHHLERAPVVKVLSGGERPDQCEMRLRGAPVSLKNPADAQDRGVETVYQSLALCANLGTAYNLALGREPRRTLLGIPFTLDRRACLADAAHQLSQLGIRIDDLLRPMSEFSGGQRQAVAIARAVRNDAKTLILDEPTAALGVHQTDTVLRLARSFADRGVAVIMVTHDVESVLKVSDRVVVLNDDRDLVQLMAGIPIEGAAESTAVARVSPGR